MPGGKGGALWSDHSCAFRCFRQGLWAECHSFGFNFISEIDVASKILFQLQRGPLKRKLNPRVCFTTCKCLHLPLWSALYVLLTQKKTPQIKRRRVSRKLCCLQSSTMKLFYFPSAFFLEVVLEIFNFYVLLLEGNALSVSCP